MAENNIRNQNAQAQSRANSSSDAKSQVGRDKGIRSHRKGTIIGLAIATGILGASTLGLGVAYGVSMSQSNSYSLQLESIYKKNYYELVDNVNSADMKISKLLASDNLAYQGKMLTELSQTAKAMQSNVASLPINNDNIYQSVRFINQMSGYTQVLEKKIAEGGSLSEADKASLSNMHEALTEMKRQINHLSAEMGKGYSITEASARMSGNSDDFSANFVQLKAADADYPTMIYDGPFSDSVVNQEVKGLKGATISKEEAYKKVDKMFKNIANLKYDGETNGKFSTYNFSLMTSDDQDLYVQVTKIGGHILDVSGNVESGNKSIGFEQAKKIALDFAKENGVEDATVVWNEELDSQIYFNIAPKAGGIILYPDLVKVKVDMEKGNVVGYDAVSYFINHTDRNLTKASISADSARANIDDSFEIVNERLVLAPLEYAREVLCFEFECQRNGATYYIYINAATGVEENVLKVVETDDGSKLM